VRKKLGLTLAVTGIAALLLLPQAVAQASPAPTPSARPSAATITTLPVGVTFNPKAAKCTTAKSTTGTIEHCIQSQRLPLKELSTVQRAQRKRMMAQHAALAQRKPTSANLAAPAVTSLTPPGGCTFTNNQTFTYTAHPDRFTSCVDGLWTVIDWEVIDGAVSPVGIFEYEDQAWITYSATSTSWTHSMNTYAYVGGGTLSGGLSGTLYSNCFISAACTAESAGVPDPQPVTLTSGGSYSYQWNEQDAGPATTTAGDVDTLDSDLGVTWDFGYGTNTDISTETGLAGRCDDVTQSDDGDPGDDSTAPPDDNGPGCVDEGYVPTLYLSLAKYGAAAEMILWAQYALSGHWGLQGEGQPLHRLIEPILQKNNREIICETDWAPDGTLTSALQPYNDTDSCDEYPFASSYESGAMEEDVNNNAKPYVTTGASCAQFIAAKTGSSGVEATDWPTTTDLATPTGNELCVRSHNPNRLNSAVGSAYWSLISADRLIDKDPFWVLVTS
jgi:hypothetical protein